MGRGNLSRALALGGAAAIAAVAVAAAVAAPGLRWSPLVTGSTEPSGARTPVGYVAVTRAQERRFLPRLTADDRRAVQVVPLARTAVVALFLDGFPCASHLAVTGVTRARTVLTVRLAFTPPPPGVAMCIRTSTPYLAVGISRKSLGSSLPTHVSLVAHARA
jgi:hypothetical protein